MTSFRSGVARLVEVRRIYIIMTLVINDVLLVRLFLAHLSLFKMFTSMTSCDPLTVVFVLCIIPVLCCNHVWCDE